MSTRRASLIVSLVALLATVAASASASPPQPPADPRNPIPLVVKPDPREMRGEWVAGEVLVALRPDVAAPQRHAALAAVAAERVRALAVPDVYLVELGDGVSVAEAVRRYSRDPRVELAEPNWYRIPAAFFPNDPRFGDQWGLHNTGQLHHVEYSSREYGGTVDADADLPEAWDVERGDPSVVIAVIDSGVDVHHADLDARLWVNPGEVPDNGLDDDANGYIDDVHGWDTAENDATLLEQPAAEGYAHGTHVAGTIAAETDNLEGVAGVCGGGGADAGCRLMVLKFMNDDYVRGEQVMIGKLSAEVEAIQYAIDNGADVINASFGSYAFSGLERSMLSRAGAKGILTVAAAGNDSLDNDVAMAIDYDRDGRADAWSPLYPASYSLPTIVSVAASHHDDEYAYVTVCFEEDGYSKNRCAFSNFGRFSVDLAAPGVDVRSTWTWDRYRVISGTSMATPHVAGVAGLLLSSDPTLAPTDVKNKIMNGTARAGLPLNTTMRTFLYPYPGPPEPTSGPFTETAGRLDADDALAASSALATPEHDGDIPGAVALRQRADGHVAWPPDANDVYRKRLTGGERYRFTLAVPSGRDYDLFLYRPGAVEIWQPSKIVKSSAAAGSTDEAVTITPRRTGVFHAHVASWFATGAYTLRARCVSC